MSERIIFDYFKGQESEMLSFYRIPKLLFTNAYFKGLDVLAKTLYGLMLDRMSLSLKNKWFDEEQRAYIYFAQQEAAEMLDCGEDKIRILFKNLEEYGLIERRKQGQGKPSIIYLKNFVSEGSEEVQTLENPGSESEIEVSDPGNIGVKTTEKSGSRPRKIRVLDHGNSGPNYNNINNTNLVITNHISSKQTDLNEDYEIYSEMIRENLSLDTLLDRYPQEREAIEGMYEIVLETVLSTQEKIHIAKNDYPKNLVKAKLLKLNSMHVEYVLDCMKNNTTKIKKIRPYLLATLFNAPSTMSSYYQAEVNHDMACGLI